MSGFAGLTFRHPTDDDLVAAAGVLSAEEKAIRGRVTYGAEELRDWWRRYDLDASWIVENDEGDPIAFAGFFAQAEESNVWVAVDPRYNGRGISTELIGRVQRRAREAGGGRLKAGCLAENSSAQRLLEHLGFREVRRFFRMQIDFDGEPSQPNEIEGIRIAMFRPEDARAFHAAISEALADDWGFIDTPFDEWKKLRLNAPETDTSLWFIAWADDEIAGAVRCDARKFGGGFVGALGVRRPWRRRGIGEALLRRVFVEYHRRGTNRVSLGVDASNRSGATRLYERLGMSVVSEDLLFEKVLT